MKETTLSAKVIPVSPEGDPNLLKTRSLDWHGPCKRENQDRQDGGPETCKEAFKWEN